VLEQYPKDVKIVIKNFPLRNHKFAMNAAVAALAAEQQGKYWEYHTELFKNYNQISDAKIDEIAGLVGLDMKQFKKDMQNPALSAKVERDLQDGIKAGVRGTPTIFVNGRLLQQRSLPGFQQLIDEELTKKKKK
jgi:protein-disulfide isomerase